MFDGIHKPRQAQLDILDWISKNKEEYEVLGIQAPTGLGKSALFKALANVIITPSNHLIDQYQATYTNLNCLKGAEHYDCKKAGDCETARTLFKRTCQSCPYADAKAKLKSGRQSIANPMSYYYFTLDSKFIPPKVLGVDEADKLEHMLKLAATLEIKHIPSNRPPETECLDVLLPWLKEDTERSIKRNQFGKAGNLQRIIYLVEKYPGNFKIHQNAVRTLLYPLQIHSGFLQNVTKSKTLILMSATLFESDVKRIAGTRSYKYIQVESPIPVENRRIIYRPILKYGRPDLKRIPGWINEQIKRESASSTICHVTYQNQTALRLKLPNAICNARSNKNETAERIKKEGGLWLAAGCHEGIDLKDDACRLNLIPVLSYENIADPIVKSRLDLQGGQWRYQLDTLRRTIQQIGRTTRGTNDYSTTIIGDPRFPKLVSRFRRYLPKSFLDSIVWRVK